MNVDITAEIFAVLRVSMSRYGTAKSHGSSITECGTLVLYMMLEETLYSSHLVCY